MYCCCDTTTRNVICLVPSWSRILVHMGEYSCVSGCPRVFSDRRSLNVHQGKCPVLAQEDSSLVGLEEMMANQRQARKRRRKERATVCAPCLHFIPGILHSFVTRNATYLFHRMLRLPCLLLQIPQHPSLLLHHPWDEASGKSGQHGKS